MGPRSSTGVTLGGSARALAPAMSARTAQSDLEIRPVMCRQCFRQYSKDIGFIELD